MIFKKIVALPSMVYIVGFDAYELRLGDKMPSMTL